jgi:membrane protease YdiL (CAAX protease family)
MNEFFSSPEEDPDFSVDSSTGLDAGQEGLSATVPEAVDSPADALADDTYWSISRTPLTSLVFSLPLVLAYEGGVLLLGHGTPRNGADVWLRQLLDLLGFGAYFLLPLLTVVGLLAWHHVAHDRWHFSAGVLLGMAAESLLWAFLLIGIARLQETLWPLAVDQGPVAGLLARFVGFCGAGLYEEVLFRLLLLPAVIWLLERWGQTRLSAASWGVLLTSLVFSGAHYVGPLGDTFTLYSFTFRTLAGLFFSLVFLARGFGIAAGAHAAYDLLVGLA